MRKNFPHIEKGIPRPDYDAKPIELDPTTVSVSALLRSGYASCVNDRSAEYKCDSTDFVGNGNRIAALSRSLSTMVRNGVIPEPTPPPAPVSE